MELPNIVDITIYFIQVYNIDNFNGFFLFRPPRFIVVNFILIIVLFMT